MSNYIYHNGTLMNSELYHYGVKGMKWGVRKKQAMDEYMKASRSAKSQKEADKARAKYEKTVAEIKADKKYFKASVKALKEARGKVDDIVDSKTGIVKARVDRSAMIQSMITMEKGEEYCKQVLNATNRSIRNTNIALLAGTAAFAIGSTWASRYTYNRY